MNVVVVVGVYFDVAVPAAAGVVGVALDIYFYDALTADRCLLLSLWLWSIFIVILLLLLLLWLIFALDDVVVLCPNIRRSFSLPLAPPFGTKRSNK